MWAIGIQNTNLKLQIHSSYFATRWKFWLETWSNLSLDRRLILLSAFEKMFLNWDWKIFTAIWWSIVWRCFWTMDKNTLSYLAISKVALKYLISCWSWMSKVQIMILKRWFAHLHSNQYECVCISKSGPCNVRCACKCILGEAILCNPDDCLLPSPSADKVNKSTLLWYGATFKQKSRWHAKIVHWWDSKQL